ncbi:DNA-binding domain-containing protein [Rhizobium giardinii]|uniref:DNA-binding domain-containing protein n=1 Tax=Rhizobium giardinii TaxID=56731 RepID=UPI003D6E12E3
MRNDIHDLNESDLSENRLCAEFVEAYFTPTRPTMTHLYRNMLSELSQENERRALAGLLPLHWPSFSTFRRRIRAFPVAVMLAARHGMHRA